ncbi:MAG: hypothetical protein AB7E52_09200 [Bdellovibrionales bacterium]
MSLPDSYNRSDLIDYLQKTFPQRNPEDILNALNPVQKQFKYDPHTGHLRCSYGANVTNEEPSAEYDWIFDVTQKLIEQPPSFGQAIAFRLFSQEGRPEISRQIEPTIRKHAFKTKHLQTDLKRAYQAAALATEWADSPPTKQISEEEARELQAIVENGDAHDQIALYSLFTQCEDEDLQAEGRYYLIKAAFHPHDDQKRGLARKAITQLEWPQNAAVGIQSFRAIHDVLTTPNLPYTDCLTAIKNKPPKEIEQIAENCLFFLDSFDRFRPSKRRLNRSADKDIRKYPFLLSETHLLQPLLRMTAFPNDALAIQAWKTISLFQVDEGADINQIMPLLNAAVDTIPAARAEVIRTLGSIFAGQGRKSLYAISHLAALDLYGDTHKDHAINCMIGRLVGKIAPLTLEEKSLENFTTRVLQTAAEFNGEDAEKMTSPLVHVAKTLIDKGKKALQKETRQGAAKTDNQHFTTAASYLGDMFTLLTRSNDQNPEDRYTPYRYAALTNLLAQQKRLPADLQASIANKTAEAAIWLMKTSSSAYTPTSAKRRTNFNRLTNGS